MKWEQMTCPTCHEPASELAENRPVQWPIELIDGEYDYIYEQGARDCYEDFPLKADDGSENLYCPNGHDWWTKPIGGEEQGVTI